MNSLRHHARLLVSIHSLDGSTERWASRSDCKRIFDCVSCYHHRCKTKSSATAEIARCGLEMTVGMGFPLGIGISRKWDKHRVNCGNGNGNGKRPGWEWEETDTHHVLKFRKDPFRGVDGLDSPLTSR